MQYNEKCVLSETEVTEHYPQLQLKKIHPWNAPQKTLLEDFDAMSHSFSPIAIMQFCKKPIFLSCSSCGILKESNIAGLILRSAKKQPELSYHLFRNFTRSW